MKSLKSLKDFSANIEFNEISYNAEINRNQPSAFIFMIDQSGSMGMQSQLYNGIERTYSYIVSDMINNMLNELISRCTKSNGVRDYFEICLIGYGGQSEKKSNILWEGSLKEKKWVSISELKSNAKYEKRIVTKNIRGKIKTEEVNCPYWIKPVSNHLTPMGHAFEKAFKLLEKWVFDHKDSYPPVVINITDGNQTDYNNVAIVDIAKKVQNLNTKDGNVLVLNAHISGDGAPFFFPLSIEELKGNMYSKRLFKMSSYMPLSYSPQIAEIRGGDKKDVLYKGMTFNASMDQLFNFIDIGTSGATQKLTSN